MQSPQVPMKAAGSRKNISQKTEEWKAEEKAQIATVIGRVFDLQKQFGKNTSQLENIIDGFCWALKVYPVDKVIWGFGEYILNHSDMPTPADIRQIIDPVKPVWKPDRSYYISLIEIKKQQGPFGLDTEEIEYIKAYEEYHRNEMRESS